MPEHRTSYSCTLTDEQREKLRAILENGNYPKVEVPYADIAVKGEDFSATLYTSG